MNSQDPLLKERSKVRSFEYLRALLALKRHFYLEPLRQ